MCLNQLRGYAQTFTWTRASIVEKASHYIYSSVSNYVSDSGLLKIDKADFPIVDILNLNNFTKYNEY